MKIETVEVKQEKDLEKNEVKKEEIKEEKKPKYVANKFTGLLHPYSYGLYTPKQARNQKKEPSNDNQE